MTQRFKCSICGYEYDVAAGIPHKGIAPGTRWEDLPGDFVCPVCSAPKSVFKPLEEAASGPRAVAAPSEPAPSEPAPSEPAKDMRELSPGEISAICSNLSKGCEKQRLTEEMEAWNKIADYYKARAAAEPGKTLADAAEMLDDDMAGGFPAARSAAEADGDRGTLRSLTWSEKVSAMMGVLLARFAKEGDAMLENTKIYVCDICGFIMIGDTPPETCPVCKVPRHRIRPVERR